MPASVDGQPPEIPAYLDEVPSSGVSDPVVTSPQLLPFHELSWEDFERLCLRVVRLYASPVHCQIYGVPGQRQEGIDIFARLRSKSGYVIHWARRTASASRSAASKAMRTRRRISIASSIDLRSGA